MLEDYLPICYKCDERPDKRALTQPRKTVDTATSTNHLSSQETEEGWLNTLKCANE